MSAHVVCVTSAGGLPVFNRKKGDCEQLPFSIIGTLGGIHMFSKSQNINLDDVSSDNSAIIWKEFHESYILIAVTTGATQEVVNLFLESVFNAMILTIGIDQLLKVKNIERLKRDLRPAFPIIDRLLDSLDCGDSNKNSSDLIMLSETILCPENNNFKTILESYGECVDSSYCCVLIHGKIATATDSWWTLHPDERKMLCLVASSEHTSATKDVPVYLPQKSPNIAFRLISCSLIPDVQVCCLCGPTITLEDIEYNVGQCFKNAMDMLKSAEQCYPKNFPTPVQLDANILGILLIDSENGKFLSSRNPQIGANRRPSSGSHRLDILRTFFYKTVIRVLWPKYLELDSLPLDNSTLRDEQKDDPKMRSKSTLDETLDDSEDDVEICAEGLETYWCSEYHKCHAMKIENNIICVLYASSIPTFAMSKITEKTLEILTSDKQLCW